MLLIGLYLHRSPLIYGVRGIGSSSSWCAGHKHRILRITLALDLHDACAFQDVAQQLVLRRHNPELIDVFQVIEPFGQESEVVWLLGADCHLVLKHVVSEKIAGC